MKFNSDKCVFMTVSNKRYPLLNQYNINGEALSKKEMIKYLGVIIDNKLTFREHIQYKVKKATTVLNMLKRNLYFAPKSVKSKAYIACVLPILEYGSTCWSPTSVKQNNALEMVHHQAAKFASNIYPKKGRFESFSISKILKDLKWDSLEERRNQSRLVMAFKIINKHVILDAEMMPKFKNLQPTRKCNEANVGYQNQLAEPESKIDVTKSTFFYATPKLWNNRITPNQAQAPSIDAFKHHFKK